MMRHYTNDKLTTFDPTMANVTVEWIASQGPVRQGDFIPLFSSTLWGEGPIVKFIPGDQVKLTGNFRLNVERDYTDEGMEVFEYEDAEIVLPTGETAWVSWVEFDWNETYSLKAGWEPVVPVYKEPVYRPFADLLKGSAA